jgi:GMP synthase (glutamine-hydrolysing)
LAGHWHGDMPGLTPESKVLARSEGCPRQIVKYSPKVYGFQCHFEFTPKTIKGMIKNCGKELKESKNLQYVQSEKELMWQDYDSINQWLFTFLDYQVRTWLQK